MIKELKLIGKVRLKWESVNVQYKYFQAKDYGYTNSINAIYAQFF